MRSLHFQCLRAAELPRKTKCLAFHRLDLSQPAGLALASLLLLPPHPQAGAAGRGSPRAPRHRTLSPWEKGAVAPALFQRRDRTGTPWCGAGRSTSSSPLIQAQSALTVDYGSADRLGCCLSLKRNRVAVFNPELARLTPCDLQNARDGVNRRNNVGRQWLRIPCDVDHTPIVSDEHHV